MEITLLGKAINKLSPREQTIIRLRFGLNNAGRKREDAERSRRSSWNLSVLYFQTGETDYETSEKRNRKV